jgi:hypothetical protein
MLTLSARSTERQTLMIGVTCRNVNRLTGRKPQVLPKLRADDERKIGAWSATGGSQADPGCGNCTANTVYSVRHCENCNSASTRDGDQRRSRVRTKRYRFV